MNKYGIDNFEFIVIETCTKSKLIEREQFYIDTLNPSYNLRKFAESNLGHKWTEEQKQRHSEVHKGIPSSRKGIKTGKPAWNNGIPQTEQTKKKLSEVQKGRRNSPNTEFKKGVISTRKVSVYCVELDIVFSSYTEAAIHVTGNALCAANIIACINGKQKTAYGFTWKSTKE